MERNYFDTPILLMAFNRPDTTKLVFEEIRKIRPKKLFVAVDGPRNEKEEKKVKEVQKIVSKINWPCKVKKLFRKKNLGCFNACVGAVSWFFENIDEGIILEEDCLPDQSFFYFCKELLEKYRDNDKIMHISGTNFQRGWKKDNYSYYFSNYPYMWGWATWRRAWKKYNPDINLYLKFKNENLFFDIFQNRIERIYIKHILESYYFKKSQGWDNPWLLTIFINNGLSIVPNENLVKNIGFANNTTHSRVTDSFLSIPTKKITFPLKHPSDVILNKKADERYVKWRLMNQIKMYAITFFKR